jgi:ferritin
MADEENEHANKFMQYQNKRGGTIVLLDVKVCQLLYFFIKIAIFFGNLETTTTRLGFASRSS